MINSNNNKGNPYHDENGHFTSKDNQGSGSGEKKQPINPQKILGQMGLGNQDIKNEIYEAKRDLAYKGGWTPDIEGNPRNDVNHFLINKSLDNLKKGYGVGEESPVNKEWAEDLAYQFKNDGVPEEAIPELIEIFQSEAPSWEEAHQKQSDQKALDDLGAKMDKLEDTVEDEEVNSQKIANQMGLSEEDFDENEDAIEPDSFVSVTLPDGGSDRVKIDNIGDKLNEFLEYQGAELTDTQKQFIKENGVVPKSLSPMNEDIFLDSFTEWLKENYYQDEDDGFDPTNSYDKWKER